MLSKSQISFVNALHHKKHRKEQGLFIAEGTKSIAEFLTSEYTVDSIYSVPQALPKLGNFSQKIKLHETTESELRKISTLTTPQDALALIRIPETTVMEPKSFKNRFSLVLDGVQDPGNLGTIIRTADWFGFTQLVCSLNTVEAYNPKVVQATMGSLPRVQIYYTDLTTLFHETSIPVYGALLNGQSVYEVNFGNEGFLVLGNEGNGISSEIEKEVQHSITIPRFGQAESLNVAVSAAILCSELKRRG